MRKKKLTNRILAWSAAMLLVVLLGLIVGVRISAVPNETNPQSIERDSE